MKKIIIAILITNIGFCLLGCSLFQKYEVVDITQYEKVRETGYYKRVEQYSSLVMPEEIAPLFEVQDYLFSFDPMDESYEEFLEVTIEDSVQYKEYCEDLFDTSKLSQCLFDPMYQEYIINNEVSLTTNNQMEQCLLTARVQKIMVNNDAQSIIFVSISIPGDYGPISLSRFKYFTRFDVLDEND